MCLISLTPHTLNSLQKLHCSPVQNITLWKSPQRQPLSATTSLITFTFASIQISNTFFLAVYLKFTILCHKVITLNAEHEMVE